MGLGGAIGALLGGLMVGLGRVFKLWCRLGRTKPNPTNERRMLGYSTLRESFAYEKPLRVYVPQTPLLSTRGTRAQEWLPNLQFMPILGLKTDPSIPTNFKSTFGYNFDYFSSAGVFSSKKILTLKQSCQFD